MSQVFTVLFAFFQRLFNTQCKTLTFHCSRDLATLIHILGGGAPQSLGVKNQPSVAFELSDFPFIAVGRQLTVVIV